MLLLTACDVSGGDDVACFVDANVNALHLRMKAERNLDFSLRRCSHLLLKTTYKTSHLRANSMRFPITSTSFSNSLHTDILQTFVVSSFSMTSSANDT